MVYGVIEDRLITGLKAWQECLEVRNMLVRSSDEGNVSTL